MSIRREFAPFVEELEREVTPSAERPRYRDGVALARDALDALRSRHVFHGDDPVELQDGERHRYIIAAPSFQGAAGPSAGQALGRIEENLGTFTLRRFAEGGARVLALTPLEAATLRERFRALAVEPDVRHHLPRTPLVDPVEPILVPARSAQVIVVRVRAGEVPVPSAIVTLVPGDGDGVGYVGLTDSAGEATFRVRRSEAGFARVVVEPHARYWSRVLTHVAARPTIDVPLSPLATGGFDWGHRALGAGALGPTSGRGVRVAIIDSGVARHPSLRVRDGRNLVLGESADAWDEDVEGHGTHCAGVVAALTMPASTWGYAPEVDLHALRVIGADGSGYSSDIVAAIHAAVEELGCDILNMSFVSGTASPFLRQAIERAVERGVLCVAAAGNDGGPVQYPAAFPGVVAVSAVGRRGTYPADSIHRTAETTPTADGYYLASFSNRGPEIAFAGPGVAITSTVPAEDVAAWDGTSMACPHVAGVAAVALESMLSDAPGLDRAVRLLDRLRGSASDLGLPRDQQGAGLPRIPPLQSSPPWPPGVPCS